MSNKILKLDQAQTLYQDLRGRIDALPTSEDIPDVPVQDVQVNGTSIVENGVANVPMASNVSPGVVKVSDNLGVYKNSEGFLTIGGATSNVIKYGTTNLYPVVPGKQHESTFYGLAKSAGDTTQSQSANAVGTYTNDAKQKIQNMLGITDLISTEETSTATAAHALNSTFMMNGKLHRATAAIAIGDAVEVGTNCEVVKADEVFVKKTDYATGENAGVVKVQIQGGLTMINGVLALIGASEETIKEGSYQYVSISPKSQHQSVFYGLSKVAGVDLKNETVTLGTYPETSKTAIRSLIGAAAAADIPSVPVQDVQVNGTSVLSGGIANVPVASNSALGAIKVDGFGMGINNSGVLYLNGANTSQIKAGTYGYGAITATHQHESTFYGLTKAAGVDMASSSNPVGTYTNEAKVAIRTMLGAASPNVIAVQDEQPTDTETKVWLPETEAQGIQVPTMEDMNTALAGKVGDVQVNGSSVVSNGVANIPVANSSTYGVSKIDMYPTTDSANAVRSGGVKSYLNNKADKSEAYQFITGIQASSTSVWVGRVQNGVTSLDDVKAILYKLPYANPSGVPVTLELQCYAQNSWAEMLWTTSVEGSSTNVIYDIPVYYNGTALNGDYAAGTVFAMHFDNGVWYVDSIMPENVVSALENKIDDVQVNGTSIVSSGVADIPKMGTNQFGVAQVSGSAYGVGTTQTRYLYIVSADIDQAKTGTHAFRPLTPSVEDASTFYGLAKAAGDATQAASSNAIGTYTTEAKAAIHTMLGIDPASIAAQVDIPLVETISGTTPTITGQPNTRYVCGEVSTISITPPSAGSVDVIFESGSTAAALTVPNTVKWPAWFDATTLEADTTYEILITDGVYGSVMTWAN